MLRKILFFSPDESLRLAMLTKTTRHIIIADIKLLRQASPPRSRPSLRNFTASSPRYFHSPPSKMTISTPDTLHSAAKPTNAWSHPGPSAFDFRSDTITTPTTSMLNAITATTLMDDVFTEDPTTNALESHLARLTGHESALLVMSGTMANQVALKTHLIQPPHSVLCDIRGHIYNYEAGGVSSLSSAQLIATHPSNNHHLTLEDVQKHAIISDNVHYCPTRVISLENTLDGTIFPLDEIKRISAFARSHGIKMHLDGARLWEVASTGHDGTLTRICEEFDSVSLCFSKGLGAPIGSIIVGSKPFIDHARRIRKMLGGGTRQAGIISAAARVAVDENFGSGPSGEGGKLRATHLRAKKVADMWEAKGGKLTNPTETNMVWLDLEHQGVSDADFVQLGEEEGVKLMFGRLVVHYQIGEEAVERLGRVMDKTIQKGREKAKVSNGSVGTGEVNGDRYG